MKRCSNDTVQRCAITLQYNALPAVWDRQWKAQAIAVFLSLLRGQQFSPGSALYSSVFWCSC